MMGILLTPAEEQQFLVNGVLSSDAANVHNYLLGSKYRDDFGGVAIDNAQERLLVRIKGGGTTVPDDVRTHLASLVGGARYLEFGDATYSLDQLLTLSAKIGDLISRPEGASAVESGNGVTLSDMVSPPSTGVVSSAIDVSANQVVVGAKLNSAALAEIRLKWRTSCPRSAWAATRCATRRPKATSLLPTRMAHPGSGARGSPCSTRTTRRRVNTARVATPWRILRTPGNGT